MTSDGPERSIRSFAPVIDEDLERLAAIARQVHAVRNAARPEWTRTLLAACLVQGGARHRVHGDRGVKDFDIYLFYEVPERSARGFPWNKNSWQYDFGPSPHGKQLYTDDDRSKPSLARRIPSWERFDGRRVDVLVRCIASSPDGPRATVRAWLERGANEARRGRPVEDMPSAWHLARCPVIALEPDLGEVWWDGPVTDEPYLERNEPPT